MYKIFLNNKPVILSASKPKSPRNTTLLKRFKGKKHLEKLLRTFAESDEFSMLVVHHWDLDDLFYAFRRIYKVIHAAGGLVKNSQGELLVIKRNGKWDIPKGKMDPGEKPKQTALREVQEECGVSGLSIRSDLGITYHVYRDKGVEWLKKTWWYHMDTTFEGELVPQVEEGITKVKWVKPEKLPAYSHNTYQSIREIFQAFGN